MTAETLPQLCDHLTESSPYAGLEIAGTPHLLCPACFTDKCALLLYDHSASEVSKMSYVETEHIEAVTFALHGRRLKERDQRLSNRVNSLKQHLYRRFAKPKFVRQPYGVSDGIPSYQRRLCHFERAHEPRSLSNASHVEVWNRVTA
jgi:hypothetical protein